MPGVSTCELEESYTATSPSKQIVVVHRALFAKFCLETNRFSPWKDPEWTLYPVE